MKRISISILAFFIFNLSFSQISHIDVLIGKLDSDVTRYLDSLHNLKSNPYYKIKRDVTNNGDMLLSVEFSLADQSYYNCLRITTRFTRSQGSEFCTTQYITGKSEFAKPNLDFIKDNFTFVQEKNIWEKVLIPGQFKVVATFESAEKFYTITYKLQEISNLPNLGN